MNGNDRALLIYTAIATTLLVVAVGYAGYRVYLIKGDIDQELGALQPTIGKASGIIDTLSKIF